MSGQLSSPVARGCGGIGRRARFRSVWGKPRGGSSPLIRIGRKARKSEPFSSHGGTAGGLINRRAPGLAFVPLASPVRSAVGSAWRRVAAADVGPTLYTRVNGSSQPQPGSTRSAADADVSNGGLSQSEPKIPPAASRAELTVDSNPRPPLYESEVAVFARQAEGDAGLQQCCKQLA